MTRLTRNLDGEADTPAELFIWDGHSVHTETTNTTGINAAAGWLAYDATCGFCVRWVERVRGILERRHIRLVPLQAAWIRQRLGLRDGEQADRIWLILSGGAMLGGADALIELARRVGWARPLAMLAGFPGVRGLLHRGYGWIARHRHCLGGTCELPPHDHPRTTPPPRHLAPRWRDWLPLLVLPVAAILIARGLPAWVFMWVLAVAVFLGCKWIMFRTALRRGGSISFARAIAFFITWPGLDARAFLDEDRIVPHPAIREWLFAAVKTLLGAALLWIVAPSVPAEYPLFAGWTVMVGIIFVLHFGLFHLLTLAWRRAGIDAPLMMRNPIASRSLAEFWGKRWNRDFRIMAHELIFLRLYRRLGTMGAAFAVFLISGLVHDLVISLPAGAGFGLPTAYFLAQFTGIWFEATPLGKRLGLGRGVTGWLFTLLITAGPMFALFHPPFVHEVILPFAQVIGGR